jgi:type I restriction-modification system DNA methylase subunit
MDAAEYKNVVEGLVLLKLLSRGFEERDANLSTARAEGADPEDHARYDFWMPPEARWAHLKAQAGQPTIGQLVDDAMSWLERPSATVDTTQLGQLIDLVSNLDAGDLLPEFHTPVPPTDVHDASGTGTGTRRSSLGALPISPRRSRHRRVSCC